MLCRLVLYNNPAWIIFSCAATLYSNLLFLFLVCENLIKTEQTKFDKTKPTKSSQKWSNISTLSTKPNQTQLNQTKPNQLQLNIKYFLYTCNWPIKIKINQQTKPNYTYPNQTKTTLIIQMKLNQTKLNRIK